MSAEVLSRIQFGFFVGFHYLFVTLSLGLSLLLVVMEGMYLATKKKIYQDMLWFWVQIFALTFVLGVVTGIMQIFSFGANWARFSDYTGNIFGVLLGSEGIFAFFLESIFLGVLVFGRNKVSDKVHFFAACMVWFGAHMSAFWIVCANSWMQTPSGYVLEESLGKLVPVLTSFWGVVFSPTCLTRFVHVVLGAWLSGIFLLIGVNAYYIRKQRFPVFASKGLKVGVIAAACVLLLQLWSADVSARGIAKHQPAKLAAFEGLYKTEEYSKLYLFGYVDTKHDKVRGIAIPGALSFLVHRNIKTPVTGLDQIPRDEWPNVHAVFQAYHLMVMLWGCMVLLTVLGWFIYKGKSWARSPLFLWVLAFSVIIPELCNQVGWMATEMGRQPWAVYGLLKTKDATSAIVPSQHIYQTLCLFGGVFALLLFLFIFILIRKVRTGPDQTHTTSEY